MRRVGVRSPPHGRRSHRLSNGQLECRFGSTVDQRRCRRELRKRPIFADLLIDTAGETWDPRSPVLRQRFEVDVAGADLPDFLVRNQGYIGVKFSGEALAVHGAPGRISYAATAELATQIERLAPRRCSLSWHDGQWHHEIMGDPDRVRVRLLGLMLKARERLSRRYLLQPRNLASLVPSHRYARLLGLWRERAGQIDLQADRTTLNEVTNGKFLFVEPDTDRGFLKFTAIGPGNEMYRDKAWADRFNNGPVEVQPDMNFGAWVANGYRSVLASREPELSDIDAVVHDPRIQISRHYTFSRLILPLTAANGTRRLLSAPLADNSIRLGIEPDEEVHRILP